MKGGSLAARNATNYESCYFIFETDLNVWRTDARKVIWVESIENMDFFVFKGSDRLNTTLMQAQFDESSGVYYYSASSSEQLMLVTQNFENKSAASISFNM